MKCLESLYDIKNEFNVFLFDQWGVIHNGENLYPNAERIFKDLLEENKLIFVVSNSGKKSSDNIGRLQQMGAKHILKTEIITSGDVCLNYLTENKGPCKDIGKNYYPIGIDYPLLKDTNFNKTTNLEHADFLLLTSTAGFHDFENAHKEMKIALKLNIPLICSNPDILGISGKDIHPSTGDLAIFYKKIGGKTYVFGKPGIEIYEYVQAKSLKNKDEILMIGDSLFNDIAGANNFGIKSLLIKNGIHKKNFSEKISDIDTIHSIKSDLQVTGMPDFVIDELK
ncbi:MAG: TIGR01459 family HAD-type hydrolase [Pelagibacteraceae bacterium]|mgnify:CR=1 FL=1|nr:TIGR01459 family HAD-type hydrolase [Pelagibacteraceae bacterium]|tara:strand:- start:5916 stop:6761 length:846 start_codon:yes stop_codon:yes gene_type:complete